MTTREKVEQLLDRLSEAGLEAEYERLRVAVEGEGEPAASTSVFKHLDEEEAKIGFSWEQYR